jgi:hypothetical protein
MRRSQLGTICVAVISAIAGGGGRTYSCSRETILLVLAVGCPPFRLGLAAALSLESNGYLDISGAQGWLTYDISPSLPSKRPYLVTAEIIPWPTSVWQTLRLKVLRIGEAPDKPVLQPKDTLVGLPGF